MKAHITYLIIKIWSLFYPFKVLLDGNDNTVNVNRSLCKALMYLGIEKRNFIYISMLIHNHESNILSYDTDYCFQILPKGRDPQATITRELMYNSHYGIYGFEAACPTIQQMFYAWNKEPFIRIKTTCIPFLTSDGYIQFRIVNPK